MRSNFFSLCLLAFTTWSYAVSSMNHFTVEARAGSEHEAAAYLNRIVGKEQEQPYAQLNKAINTAIHSGDDEKNTAGLNACIRLQQAGFRCSPHGSFERMVFARACELTHREHQPEDAAVARLSILHMFMPKECPDEAAEYFFSMAERGEDQPRLCAYCALPMLLERTRGKEERIEMLAIKGLNEPCPEIKPRAVGLIDLAMCVEDNSLMEQVYNAATLSLLNVLIALAQSERLQNREACQDLAKQLADQDRDKGGEFKKFIAQLQHALEALE